MDTSRMNSLMNEGWAMALALGIRVLEAIALWIVGRWLIGFALRIIGKGMARQKIDPTLIRWAMVGLAAAMLCLLISGWRYHGAPTRPLTFGVGGFAGICSGAAQLGGPAVVAYWLGSTKHPVIVRASIILYFSLSTAIAIVTYVGLGLRNTTDNQFRERTFGTTWGMAALIVAEVSGFGVLFAGFLLRAWAGW